MTKLKKGNLSDQGQVYGILREMGKCELFNVMRDKDVDNGTKNRIEFEPLLHNCT
jgi:hypothetical protein